MSTEKKETLDNFIQKWEKLSDNLVKGFYNESLVKKIESLDFMKSLIGSSFLQAIQSFWKWWFKQVFIFFWYLAIIFWILGALMQIFSIFNSFVYIKWLLFDILSIGMSLLVIIIWFWMIRFKTWYPFIVIISFFYQIIFSIFSSLYASIYYYPLSSLIWYIIISCLFFIVWFALILKNKELFHN